MHTDISFPKPGLDSPEYIAENLPDSPRNVKAIGCRTEALAALLLFTASSIAAVYAEITLWNAFIDDANVWAWTLAAAILPIAMIFIPWLLISTLRKKIKSFNKYKEIYQDGVIAYGAVNTISKITGRGQEAHFVEHKWTPKPAKIRIDYTFEADDTVKTGTVVMLETSAKYLMPNSRICVLFQKNDASKNMLFPLPGKNWFLS